MKFLTRKGFLIEEQGTTYLTDTPDLALVPLQAAACTYRIALGPRAGQNVLSLQTVPTQEAQREPPNHRPGRPTQQYQLQDGVERPILTSNA